MSNGRIVALHLKPESGGVLPVETLTAIDGIGFEGDKCAGRKTRQALFISTDTLNEFGYGPGVLREQMTVEFPGLQSLAEGVRVQAGEAVFRIEGDCAPCGNMARNLGEDPTSFQEKMAGKRGMLATVERGGQVKTGDEVRVLEG